MICKDCKELFGWYPVMCFWSVAVSDFGIAKMMLLKYEAYAWWFLIRWSVELKNWLMIFIDMIYWMFSLACLFLLHFVGVICNDFICHCNLCWFQIPFMRCAVCLSSRCVQIFVIGSWLLSRGAVMNISMIGLLSFLDVVEVSFPFIYWVSRILSGWQ